MDTKLCRLAWNDTDLTAPKKIFGVLGIGVLTIIFTWFIGLRTRQQALWFVVCSLAAYAFAVIGEFIWHYIPRWIIRRNRILITTVDELSSHYTRIENSLSIAQGQFDEFKDVCKEVERSWREWQANP